VNGERLPPHDIDAEEAVIGSLLIDGTTIYQIATLLQSSNFYSERNAQIYNACLALYQRNEAINQITLAQELDRQGKLEPCGGAAYLSHLISIVPTSLDIEHYAQIVFRLSVMRYLLPH
jgi:replicative DNA helicase